jgi:hypothetical protein
MKVQIDLHTLERAEERGTNEDEIKDVIETGSTIPAKYGRIGRAKVYDFKRKRHGKYYDQKRVEVFYAIEESLVVTVTVYVFYGKWEV